MIQQPPVTKCNTMFQKVTILSLACRLILQLSAVSAYSWRPVSAPGDIFVSLSGLRSELTTTQADIAEDQDCMTLCSNNTSSEDFTKSFAVTLIIGMVVALAVSVFGVIGNTLTILTIVHQFCLPPSYRHIKRFTSTVVLLLNLALADLLYCLFSLPPTFYIYMDIYISEGVSCIIVRDMH